jgi:hypothetical protein
VIWVAVAAVFAAFAAGVATGAHLTALVLAAIAIGVLIAFVLGCVCGVHWASTGSMPWRAKSREAMTVEALTERLDAVHAELTRTAPLAGAPRPAVSDPASLVSAIEAGLSYLSQLERQRNQSPRAIEGGRHI